MNGSAEAPVLTGLFQGENRPASSVNELNDLLAGDVSELQAAGAWRPEELHIVRQPAGALAIYGSCLADRSDIEHVLRRMLAENAAPTALTDLPGSYTAVLFQPDRLTVAADMVGQFPFYYYHAGSRGLAFGSLTAPLRQSAGTLPLDTAFLAANVVLPFMSELGEGRTATTGINRLQPGHIMTADRHGEVQTEPYETFQRPSIGTIEEAAEALRAALIDAVRRRAGLGYKVTADFSGGFDSTTGAYLMARELAPSLTVVTCSSRGRVNEDLRRARQYLALAGGKVLFDAHEFEWSRAMYDGLLALPLGDEPDGSILNRGSDAEYYAFLRELGSELHINGHGADGLLDGNPLDYVGQLARPGSYGLFVRSIFETARVGLTSPLHIMHELRRRRSADPIHDFHVLSDLLLGRDTTERGRMALFNSTTAPQWLTPRARRELSDLTLQTADQLYVDPAYDPGNYYAYRAIKGVGRSLHESMQYAAGFGFRSHAVFMDNDVLRACLSIPMHLRVNPWTFKTILVKATEGLVPPLVTARGTKGDYTAEAMEGLRNAYGTIDGLLRDSRLAGWGVIEPGVVRDTIANAAMGGRPPWGSLDALLATELWLRGQESADAPNADRLPKQPNEVLTTLVPNDVRYHMPSGAYMTTRAHGAIALDLEGGAFRRINVDALRVIIALRDTGTFGGAVSLLEAQYPSVDREELRVGASRVIRELQEQGLLAEGSGDFSIAEGVRQSVALPSYMTRQEQERACARLRDYPAAFAGLVGAAALSRLTLKRRVDIIAKLHRHLARRPANEVYATHMLAAVQRVAGLYLGRMACLEQTTATVIAASLHRRRVDLVIGTKTDPDDVHVWPEAQGVPIRTPRDLPVIGVFSPIFRT